MKQPKKILIVDDEQNLLESLAHFLGEDGVEIIKCSDMAQAEYAVKNTALDAVIADIRLTGIIGREGLELLSYIKEKSPNTKVIIMTAYGSPEIQKEAYERGASFYFEKPIDLKILHNRLREMGMYSSDDREPRQ